MIAFNRKIALAALLSLSMFPSGRAIAADVVEYIHTDALGSPVAVTSAAGIVVERTVYQPYGEIVNRPLDDGLGFTGHVSDAATGLTYMQERYYDPQVGRFLSVDPVEADTGTGDNFSRYAYAYNNPYSFIDPDGRQAIKKEETAPPPPLPPITEDSGVTVVGQYTGPGAAFPTRYEAETEAMLWARDHISNFWDQPKSYIVLKVEDSDTQYTYYEMVTGTPPTAGGLKVLGSLKSLAEKTVAAAIRSRGGGGAQVQQIASNLREMPLGQVANLAARGDKEAIKAVKMVKQASTKAERY